MATVELREGGAKLTKGLFGQSTLCVGFTGTQQGVSKERLANLRLQLTKLRSVGYTVFIHGGCIGADEQAARLARRLGFKTHCYPGTAGIKRADTEDDYVAQIKPFLDRNRGIVNASTVMIAMPKTSEEELRSGTWATIRYARKIGKEPIML